MQTTTANPVSITFDRHDLCIFIYRASRVRVEYAGMQHTQPDLEISRDKGSLDAQRYPSITSGPYAAFASPLAVTWTSQDGEAHTVSLNLNHIFEDRHFLLSEPKENIYMQNPIADGCPTIILEVNDRTLTVDLFANQQVIEDQTRPTQRTIKPYRLQTFLQRY